MLDLADYAAAINRRLPGWVLLPARGRTVPSLHSLRVKDTYRPRERDEAELLTWTIPGTEGPEVTPPTPVRFTLSLCTHPTRQRAYPCDVLTKKNKTNNSLTRHPPTNQPLHITSPPKHHTTQVRLRSKRSEQVTYVEFRNNTRGVVRLLWIDFHGNEVAYPLIASGQTFRQHTFLTHPWIFRDVETGRQCVTDNQQTVFFPDSNVARCTIGGLALTTAECPALPWVPSRHHMYPPNAKMAVKQLLLCHRRISKVGADGPAPLTGADAATDAADTAANNSASPPASGGWLCIPSRSKSSSGNRRQRVDSGAGDPPFRNTRSRRAKQAEAAAATAVAEQHAASEPGVLSTEDVALSLDDEGGPSMESQHEGGDGQSLSPRNRNRSSSWDMEATTLGDLPHELVLDIAAMVVPQRVAEGAPADLSFYNAAHMPYTPEKAWLVASQEPEKSRLVGQPPPLDFEALYRATFAGGAGVADRDGAEAGDGNGRVGGGPFGHILRWSTLRGMVHNCLSCACLSLCAFAFASLAR